LTNAPSASGVCCSGGKTSAPKSASRDRTGGSASAATAAALSLPFSHKENSESWPAARSARSRSAGHS
jgi:hypothetical protein